MKKLIYILGAVGLLSFSVQCNDDRYHDDYEEILSIDKVKIDSIEVVNDTMNVYSVQSIRTYSTYGNGCQNFYGYDYYRDNMNRNVTAYSYTRDGVCTQATHTQASQFNFRPEQTGTYTFKFWQGKDTAGQNLWLEQKIVVE